jgi:hypothetical protein
MEQELIARVIRVASMARMNEAEAAAPGDAIVLR